MGVRWGWLIVVVDNIFMLLLVVSVLRHGSDHMLKPHHQTPHVTVRVVIQPERPRDGLDLPNFEPGFGGQFEPQGKVTGLLRIDAEAVDRLFGLGQRVGGDGFLQVLDGAGMEFGVVDHLINFGFGGFDVHDDEFIEVPVEIFS